MVVLPPTLTSSPSLTLELNVAPSRITLFPKRLFCPTLESVMLTLVPV